MSDIYLSESFLESYYAESKQQRRSSLVWPQEESAMCGVFPHMPSAVNDDTLIIRGSKRFFKPSPGRLRVKGFTKLLRKGLSKGVLRSGSDTNVHAPAAIEYNNVALITSA